MFFILKIYRFSKRFTIRTAYCNNANPKKEIIAMVRFSAAGEVALINPNKPIDANNESPIILIFVLITIYFLIINKRF